jgi:Tfp pilus assembly protein PilZ
MQMKARHTPDTLTAFREYMSLERRRAEGLTPVELQRWWVLREKLDEVFGTLETKVSGDRRATPRIPVALAVRFENFAALGPLLMTNLSRGGIFVAMESPLPLGTILQLRIRVDRPPREVVLGGEVVSLNVGPRMESGARGMGIRFRCATRAEQALADSLYEQQVERHFDGA